MIPRIIHYVWVGTRPFPSDGQRHLDQWQRLHPDYRFMRWSEENIDFTPDFIKKAYIVGAYNRVANYARQAALRDYGGIYLDHDVELLKPLDEFLHHECFFGYQTERANEPDLVNCAIIGAVPQHRFIRRALDTLDKEFDGAREVDTATGPGLITRLLREEGLPLPTGKQVTLNDVTAYPARVFYPYEWNEAFTPSCITPDTVAIHHWAHVWKRSWSLPQRVKRKALRLAAHYIPTLSLRACLGINALRRAGGR